MTNIEIRTQSIYERLSKSEKRVADYFLQNTQSVFDQPIAQLAHNAGVSKVTWVRFCKAIGYEGLKDMKRALFSEVQDTAQDAAEAKNQSDRMIFQDIRDFTSVAQMVQTVQHSSISAIENTFKILDYDCVKRAAEAIVSAQTVKLFAVGASAMVADDLFSKLLRIGKSVCFSQDTHVQLTTAANLTPADVAVCISYSGMTTEVVEALRLAKANGARCICITKYGKNILATESDMPLYVTSAEAHYRSGAMSSRIAQLVVVDVLFSAIASMDYANVEKRLENSYRSCLSRKLD